MEIQQHSKMSCLAPLQLHAAQRHDPLLQAPRRWRARLGFAVGVAVGFAGLGVGGGVRFPGMWGIDMNFTLVNIQKTIENGHL